MVMYHERGVVDHCTVLQWPPSPPPQSCAEEEKEKEEEKEQQECRARKMKMLRKSCDHGDEPRIVLAVTEANGLQTVLHHHQHHDQSPDVAAGILSKLHHDDDSHCNHCHGQKEQRNEETMQKRGMRRDEGAAFDVEQKMIVQRRTTSEDDAVVVTAMSLALPLNVKTEEPDSGKAAVNQDLRRKREMMQIPVMRMRRTMKWRSWTKQWPQTKGEFFEAPMMYSTTG